MLKNSFKKIICTFMCICAVSASAATVNVSAAGSSSLIPLSAFRSGENTVTVLLLKTGENQEGSVSILLTDPSLGTGDESLLYIGERDIAGHGIISLNISFDSSKMNPSNRYDVIIGGDFTNGKKTLSFPGGIASSADGIYKVMPKTVSDDLLNILGSELSPKITCNGEDFSGMLKNGVEVSFYAQNVLCRLAVIVSGDLNEDDSVTATDALLCLQSAVGKTTLEGYIEKAADVNSNGSVDATDALLILQYSVGKIETLI